MSLPINRFSAHRPASVPLLIQRRGDRTLCSAKGAIPGFVRCLVVGVSRRAGTLPLFLGLVRSSQLLFLPASGQKHVPSDDPGKTNTQKPLIEIKV